jgi:hypothetical protein
MANLELGTVLHALGAMTAGGAAAKTARLESVQSRGPIGALNLARYAPDYFPRLPYI